MRPTRQRFTTRRPSGRSPAVVGTALAVGGALLAAAPPALADHGSLPDGRRATAYTVRAGDTATGLAVRFHAWTAELVSHNHLGADGPLRVGQRLEIPVVVAAARGGSGGRHGERPGRPDRDRAEHRDRDRSTPSRSRVRRVVARTARREGVDPHLALAVAWQESGWQMDRVSSAGARGAMQVLPATGRWMQLYAGRRLDLDRLRDNAAAGVLLLDVLDSGTSRKRHLVGAYYQGLGAVREHGLYDETHRYVANVLALERHLAAGGSLP